MATNYSEVQVSRGAKSLMRKVLKAYQSAQPLMDEAIEQNAREIMKNHPIVTEYVQGMGTWGFTIVLTAADGTPYFKGRMDVNTDASEIESVLDHHDHHDERENGDIVCEEHYDQLVKLQPLLAAHATMMDEFTSMFGNGLSNMRFTAEGPKTTDW